MLFFVKKGMFLGSFSYITKSKHFYIKLMYTKFKTTELAKKAYTKIFYRLSIHEVMV